MHNDVHAVVGYQYGMTFVNMKKLDAKVETRIMVLINRTDAGMNLQSVKDYFIARRMQSTILSHDLPGWLNLSEHKRNCRVNKVISRLIKEGRARVQKDPLRDPRLVPLNILDKIVFALERDDAEEKAT